MNNLPRSLFSGQQARAIDHLVMQTEHLTSETLMKRAGQAAFALLQQLWPQASSIIVCCGPGNNGGDGYVLARLAKAQGLQVTLFQLEELTPRLLSRELQQVRQEWLQSGGKILRFEDQPLLADVIVDALLGTGARHPLPLVIERMIEAINHSQLPVLALDVPSGLNVDTGFAVKAVIAFATITFISMKLGLLLEAALDCVGELYFADLAIPKDAYRQKLSPWALRLEYEEVITYLKPRKLAAHKGEHGHVCLVGGGQVGFSGAISLAAEAALRAGAGLGSVVVPPESLPLLARAPQELMCHAFTEPTAAQAVLAKATVVVIGPGLSQTAWSKAFFQAALQSDKPLLVDADGLNLLAQAPQCRGQWILTPHLGEAARLLGKTVAEIKQDKIASAIALQRKYGGVIVLKGAGTLIVDRNEHIFVNAGAFPVLATGGTGDVLAGLIGGLWAQKLSALEAAKLGVVVHSMAAKAEQIRGSRGMLASDLFLHLRSLLNPMSSSR